jgi:hypothetical protein
MMYLYIEYLPVAKNWWNCIADPRRVKKQCSQIKFCPFHSPQGS